MTLDPGWKNSDPGFDQVGYEIIVRHSNLPFMTRKSVLFLYIFDQNGTKSKKLHQSPYAYFKFDTYPDGLVLKSRIRLGIRNDLKNRTWLRTKSLRIENTVKGILVVFYTTLMNVQVGRYHYFCSLGGMVEMRCLFYFQ